MIYAYTSKPSKLIIFVIFIKNYVVVSIDPTAVARFYININMVCNRTQLYMEKHVDERIHTLALYNPITSYSETQLGV